MFPLLALTVAASLACKADTARYVLRTSPRITARFRPVESGREWPSGLAFGVHMSATGRNYWFLPWDGGTDGLQHLASTSEVDKPNWTPPSPDERPGPLRDLSYISTDASYRVLEGVPARGGMAPAHILLPELGDALWHQQPMIEPRDGAPKQFFDLVGCGP